MVQQLDYLKESPSQTAGPFVHIGLAPGDAGFEIYEKELGRDIIGPNAEGEKITVTGVVYDGVGMPLKDVLIEIWQANAAGQHSSDGTTEEGFLGWGRIISDFETGEFRFDTVKPGSVVDDNGTTMAPHISLWLVARGINLGLNTRLYFEDEADKNATDPVLNRAAQSGRADTLIAKKTDQGYHFDIWLQGENETVFLDA